MQKETIDTQRKTLESLFPKLDMAQFQLETGRARTIISIDGQECLTMQLALQVFQRWLNDKEGAEDGKQKT